jgi:hypothetical protein
MQFGRFLLAIRAALVMLCLFAGVGFAHAEGDWEITPQGEEALARGLAWLAANQGADGNWESNDLGLVSMGALAFMASGHLPGRGRYGEVAQRALEYVLRQEKPSGLLNISGAGRDMYNHGLSTFVLGQAYGMTGDARLGTALDRGLKLIGETQCDDGGWDYRAARLARGHDLSLAVMQAKALRSAVDSGLEVPPAMIQAAIQSVREHYGPHGCPRNASEERQKNVPGQFTYAKSGGGGSLAMAAAGTVCLQEFAQYEDWRIDKNMQVIAAAIGRNDDRRAAKVFDAYTLYYVGQALYQVGGNYWKECYPRLRDGLVETQVRAPSDPRRDGMWASRGRVSGKPGDMYMTSAACFILAIPNRYLPILQEGHIGSLRQQLETK